MLVLGCFSKFFPIYKYILGFYECWSTILVIIFWHFSIIYLRSESPQVKQYLLSSITKLVHEFPHKLPKDLRLRIVGNYIILEKCQMWVETQPSAQSFFQNLNVDNSCQKTRKVSHYVLETLSNFSVFLYFVSKVLSRIVADFSIFAN